MSDAAVDAAADAAVKETRRVLRLVQSHITQSRLNLGCTCDQVGFVEVMHHPDNVLPRLNYVTPRKNTAWVSVKDVEQGLETLHRYDRPQRVEFIDALFPPMFASGLKQIGLEIERETPVLVYMHDSDQPALFPTASMPDGVSMLSVNNQQGSALWWYVWRNACYDVVTDTAEPVMIGTSLMQIHMRQHLDLVMYRYGFPVGVARLTLSPEHESAHVAHLSALALMREVRTPHLLQLLQRQAVQMAISKGCSMIFTTGATEAECRISQENGFRDYGHMVCYGEKKVDSPLSGAILNEFLAQPVLARTAQTTRTLTGS